MLGLLFYYLGVAGLAGLGVMLLSMPLNMILGRRRGKLTKQLMAARDRRVKFSSEVFQGMRIAKLFGWEAPLLAQLLHLRELASLHSHSSPITSPITSPVTSFVISSFSPFVHSAFLFRISFPHSVFRTSFSALVSRTCSPLQRISVPIAFTPLASLRIIF